MEFNPYMMVPGEEQIVAPRVAAVLRDGKTYANAGQDDPAATAIA